MQRFKWGESAAPKGESADAPEPRVACPTCDQEHDYAEAVGILEGGERVCRACYEPSTRLERVLLGWVPDPYAAHREKISHGWKTEDGWQQGVEDAGDCWGLFEDNPQPSMASGLNGSLCRPPVPDLGRRCYPPDDCFGETEHRHQNDHAPKSLPVDDPSGDDVAADAPGAAEYMGVRDV